METLYQNGSLCLLDNGGTLLLRDGDTAYRITSDWHNPDTHLWRGDKPALTVYHGFSDEDIRWAAQGGAVATVTGHKYDIDALLRLLLAGIRQQLGAVDIGYLEQHSGFAVQGKGVSAGEGDHAVPPGIPLHGTLRERIAEMIDLVSIGSYADLDRTRQLYRRAGVPLLPRAEEFILRYGFLFSSLCPQFDDDDEEAEFFFDIFEEYYGDGPEAVEALREAGAEGSAMLRAVQSKAPCAVTPVGLYGYGLGATVYAGEDRRLYALHAPATSAPAASGQVSVHDNIIDLMEAELQGHIPLSLLD